VTEQVRVLALDHFSGQDREALITAGGDAFAWRTVPYWRFRNVANAIFPPDVLTGLEAWTRPELEERRREYADWCQAEFARLYIEWPFDVLLLPSDAFYYVRAFPEVCHALGVPVFVAQKETTITDYSMRAHARDVREHAPFISDRMTVCSERHKAFWVAAGSLPSSIEVTGQPRFDVYAGPGRRNAEPGTRTVLFLSYEPDAYLPTDADRTVGWRDLRAETQRTLVEAADEGWRVVIKLHPLQDRDAEKLEIEALAGGRANVVLASSDADTRDLILEADAVVGFQTTALYEAMAAGKPIAYTAWGALYPRFRSELIPFDEQPDLLDVVRSRTELFEWLRRPPTLDSALHARRMAFVEEMLGPIDGNAAARTLTVLRATAAEWAPRARASASRSALDARRRRIRPALVAAAGARTAALRAAAAFPGRFGSSASFRLEVQAERLDALRRGG
jgi:hypothetical protein